MLPVPKVFYVSASALPPLLHVAAKIYHETAYASRFFYRKSADLVDFSIEKSTRSAANSINRTASASIFNHIDQIKKALGISGISTKQSAWSRKKGEEAGTQIDMLIERKDNIVNMCEMKFYGTDFSVDKSYDKVLRSRLALLSKEISPKMAIHNTLITTFGLKYNEYSGIFSNVIDMNALFE